jgi:Ferritin-like domain
MARKARIAATVASFLVGVKGVMSDDLNSPAEPDGVWENVEVEALASRSDLLKRAAVAGSAAVAGGVLIAGLPKVAASASSRAQDVRILNYLLRLEYVMAAFYETAAAEGQLTGEIQQFVSVVGEHEQEHVALLQRILGGDANAEPSVDFGDGTSNSNKVAATARMLEETASAAYIGQGANLTKNAMIQVARITSVEARHAAWIADIVQRDPAPAAADPAKSPNQVSAALRRAGVSISG